MIMVDATNMVDTKHMDLNELSVATRENLRSLGYGDRTIYMANSIWRDLSKIKHIKQLIIWQTSVTTIFEFIYILWEHRPLLIDHYGDVDLVALFQALFLIKRGKAVKFFAPYIWKIYLPF